MSESISKLEKWLLAKAPRGVTGGGNVTQLDWLRKGLEEIAAEHYEERERWVQEMAEQQRDYRRAVASARAEGFAKAREMAADVCEREAARQREGAALLDLSTPAGRAARVYCEERERCADYLADDIRAMQDEGAHE